MLYEVTETCREWLAENCLERNLVLRRNNDVALDEIKWKSRYFVDGQYEVEEEKKEDDSANKTPMTKTTFL